MTIIDDAKLFPCPDCGVHMGQECWPREPEDSNWVHTTRRKVLEYNSRFQALR